MNTAPFVRFSESLKSGLWSAGNLIARLTFWRFVLLCLLLLMFGGIVKSAFFEREESRTIKVRKIEADARKARRDANEPVEVRIDENGIVIRRSAQAAAKDKKPGEAAPPVGATEPAPEEEKTAPAPDVKRADPDDDDDVVETRHDTANEAPVMETVLLLIVFMIILRLFANARLKAEARAASAEEAASCEILSRQLAEARLQAMQAQVEPHFLFNTLAAVEHLIETDPQRAARMQRNLIGYLRSVLPNLRRADSTLGREAGICRHYLEILKMRMEDRLDFAVEIPSGLESASLPPLMLQSLVENAIQHGIEPKPEGGRVRLAAEIVDGRLVVHVDDTGVGFGASTAPARPGSGVGLANIRERLQALFGNDASLKITANTPQGTCIRLELPYAVAKPDVAKPDVAKPADSADR